MGKEVYIEEINVKNLKNVSHFIMILNRRCAHVTGENRVGKTTIGQTFINRLKGESPVIITKIGETEGVSYMTMSDGGRFEWLYNSKGQDVLYYYAKDSLKPMGGSSLKSLLKLYFPNAFDMHKFLETTENRKRFKMMEQLLNIDLSIVHGEYNTAFEQRTLVKKELKDLEASCPEEPVFESDNTDKLVADATKLIADKVEEISNLEGGAILETRNKLNAIWTQNKSDNALLKSTYEIDCKKINDDWVLKNKKHLADIETINKKIRAVRNNKLLWTRLHEQIIETLNGTPFFMFYNSSEADEYLSEMKVIKEKPITSLPPAIMPDAPKYIVPEIPDSQELDVLNKQLAGLNSELVKLTDKLNEAKVANATELANKAHYNKELLAFSNHLHEIGELQLEVDKCELNVAEALAEIKKVVSQANLPDAFKIDLTSKKGDILFRETPDSEFLPITKDTLASSAIYISMFELQLAYIGKLRYIHFDVSFLDYKNKIKVYEKAKALGIQTVTESPASNESELELQFKIIE